MAGVHLLVAEFPCTCVHDFEVVGGRKARHIVPARHAQTALGDDVVLFQFVVGDRPVNERCTGQLAVSTLRTKFPRLKARRGCGPMNRRATNCLAMPDRHCRKVAGNALVAALGASVKPRELSERFSGNLGKSVERLALARFEENDLDSALSQFVRERAAACTRTDDDHSTIVLKVDVRHAVTRNRISALAEYLRG